MALTQERLKKQLHYNHDTGVFTRLVSTCNSVKVGNVAGGKHPAGYISIRVDGVMYLAHRLAFLYMEGYFPEHIVDHINGIRGDTRWCNLRHSSPSCNMQNTKIFKTNTSGYTGVCLVKKSNTWKAEIEHQGKRHFLGHYKTAIDAALARITAEDCLPGYNCDARGENRKKVFADLKG